MNGPGGIEDPAGRDAVDDRTERTGMKRGAAIAVLALLCGAVVGIGAVLLLGDNDHHAQQAAAPPARTAPAITQSATRTAARSQFVRHTGLALAALRTYVYEPFKSGSFTDGGLVGAFEALSKAGSAVSYAVAQLGQAQEAAKGDPALSAASAKIGDLSTHISALADGVKSGDFDPAAVASLLTDADEITALAKAAGAEIVTPRDVPKF